MKNLDVELSWAKKLTPESDSWFVYSVDEEVPNSSSGRRWKLVEFLKFWWILKVGGKYWGEFCGS